MKNQKRSLNVSTGLFRLRQVVFQDGQDKGFVLVAVLMMMILLVVAAVGLLSLSTVAIRTGGNETAGRTARANSRLALAMAIAELQKHLGDDKKITADSEILNETPARPHLVGVWRSHLDQQLTTPTATSSDSAYESRKESDFLGWLTSNPDPKLLEERDFASTEPANDAVPLYYKDMDGYDLKADIVKLSDAQNKPKGALAWAVSQAATKASINAGGVENPDNLATNAILQVPNRPNVEVSGIVKQPTTGWDTRHMTVLDMKQAVLDDQYVLDKNKVATLSMEHTVQSRGVLADVTKGGLKADFSLGFELSASDFASKELQGQKNPFAAIDTNTLNELPLYNSAVGISSGSGTVSIDLKYDPVKLDMKMDTGAIPTFHSLKSYYDMYKHLYKVGGVPTGAQRFQASAYYANPGLTAPRGSETSLSPVLDRVLLYFSLKADTDRKLYLLITPVITIWNPYNVAIESEGFVAYPSMDLPMYTGFLNGNSFLSSSGGTAYNGLSRFMGRGYGGVAPDEWDNVLHGRQAEAYFYCKITKSGNGTIGDPIRLEPGETKLFGPASNVPVKFSPNANADKPDNSVQRVVHMKPIEGTDTISETGGLLADMSTLSNGKGARLPVIPQNILPTTTGKYNAQMSFSGNDNNYFMTLEAADRIRNKDMPALSSFPRITETQIFQSQGNNTATFRSKEYTGQELNTLPRPFAVLETFHRVAGAEQSGAGTTEPPSDLVYTVNPRQRHTNYMLSGSNKITNAHYSTILREASEIGEGIDRNGGRTFYGFSNGSEKGSEYLSFFDVPQSPMLSVGGFQGADLSNSAFSPANQVGNSWASPHIPRQTTARVINSAGLASNLGGGLSPSLGLYDNSYLLNAAIWDGFFFSSISPDAQVGNGGFIANGGNYESSRNTSSVNRTAKEVVEAWIKDSRESPLRNTRHLLHMGGLGAEELEDKLTGLAGCREAAAHILVDGAFNVNSVNKQAWMAMFASLRGEAFDVTNGGSKSEHDPGDKTPTPRLSEPRGAADEFWNGFRELTDSQITELSEKMVEEVRKRGPFQSLGEFVNRRLSDGELGLAGALQAAIDAARLNSDVANSGSATSPSAYLANTNIPDVNKNTAVGIPGWLTQADLLNSMGPFITVRSDTFTIRAYGDARDGSGNVLARSWCEAVVQRVPEYVDPEDKASELPADLTPTNVTFGRKFEIVSVREMSQQEFPTTAL